MILNRRYRGKIEKIPLPMQSGTLTYNGNAQSPVWLNYDSTKVTMGGVTSSVNAGTFTATFTPKKGCCWEDGSRDAKNAAWSIGKAAGSLTLSETSASLSISALTKTITVTRAGDGTITATSSNTSVATVSVSGTTVTITGKNSGNATITVSVAADANHTAPSSKTINVSASLPSRTLANNTPAQIQATAKAGQAPNWWSVGDKIGIYLSGTVGALTLNDTYYAFIIGFNHNSSIEGNNTIHFQFGKTADGTDIVFVDSKYNNGGSSTGFRMNTSQSVSGGWKSSYMRNTICSAFLHALPVEWQNIIAFCTKYTDNVGDMTETVSNVSATLDKIWILSPDEMGGRNFAHSAERNYQGYYNYYRINGRKKKKHNDTSAASMHWSRSIVGGNSTFAMCSESGSFGSFIANWSLGFAPGFMVA